MKLDFTRWLPAIATIPNRKTALSVVGATALAGLAFGPTAVAAPITTGPHSGGSTGPPVAPAPVCRWSPG